MTYIIRRPDSSLLTPLYLTLEDAQHEVPEEVVYQLEDAMNVLDKELDALNDEVGELEDEKDTAETAEAELRQALEDIDEDMSKDEILDIIERALF
jgi:prefoldin subunit 5